jgi:hypothetical protein
MPDVAASPIVNDTYWAARDEKDFAREYFARLGLQTQGGAYGYIGRLQLLAHRHYFGALPSGYVNDMPSSAEAGREGDQGNNVTLRVNWVRAAARTRLQVVTAPKLAFECQATTTDAASLTDASRGSQILEYMWKSGPFEAAALNAAEGANIYAEEFVFTRWEDNDGEAYAATPAMPARAAQPATEDQPQDDGSIVPGQPALPAMEAQDARVLYKGRMVVCNVASWDVMRDTSAKNFEDSDWLSARVSENRFDLIARFPKFKKEILAAAAPPLPTQMGVAGLSLTTTTNTDKVLVHYFFHKRRPALPKGLQAILLDAQTVLAFDNLEDCYADPNPLPLHRFYDSNLKGTPFAYANFWEAMASQDLVTDIQQALATNIVTFGRQMISAETGTDLAPDQIGNGPVVLYRPKGSVQEVKAVQLYAPNAEMFKHLDRLRSDIRQTLGLNDLNFGEAPTGAPNAQAWALLSSASVTANSEFQEHNVAGARSMSRSMLAIFKEKATWPQKVAVIGKHGPSLATQDAFDKSDFTGISDVNVTIANALSQTAAGRVTIAQDMLKQGWVTVPEQYEAVLETGKLQPLTQVLRDELIYIASENEQLLQGEQVQAMITDSHQMHIREHKGVTFNAAARNNPNVIQAANAHIQQHLQLMLTTDPRVLGALGQASPQQPPAPGAEQTAAGQAQKVLTPTEDQQQKTEDVKIPQPPQGQPQPKPGAPHA